jgi:hypothetical protein
MRRVSSVAPTENAAGFGPVMPGMGMPMGDPMAMGMPGVGMAPGMGVPGMGMTPGMGVPGMGMTPGMGVPGMGMTPGMGVPGMGMPPGGMMPTVSMPTSTAFLPTGPGSEPTPPDDSSGGLLQNLATVQTAPQAPMSKVVSPGHHTHLPVPGRSRQG